MLKKKKKIQVIHITGVITATGSEGLLSKSYGNSATLRLLHNIKKDKNIKGVLIRLNSPGGTTGASQEIAELIEEIRRTGRPVVASIADIACSGAYMIAAACDYIFANKLSITGSIGVIMQVPNYYQLAEKIGVGCTTVKAGRFKDIGNPFREMTDEEREYLERVASETHAEFIAMVMKNRTIKNVDLMTDGRFVSAIEAKENGLIDEFGNYYTALDYLYKQIGVEEDDVKLLGDARRKKSILSRMLDIRGFIQEICHSNITIR